VPEGCVEVTVERTRPKTFWRRTERWMVGVAMGIMAFVLEKAILRAMKKGEVQAPKEGPDDPPSTTLRSKGGKVDL
jgi:hypothetical protein